MRILLVDADPRAVAELRRKLAGMGHKADCVDDPQDAAKRLRSGLYDAVIMDFGKPSSRGAWLLNTGDDSIRTKVFPTSTHSVQEIVDRIDHARGEEKRVGRDPTVDPARLFERRQPAVLSAGENHISGHASVSATPESGRAVVCVRWADLST